MNDLTHKSKTELIEEVQRLRELIQTSNGDKPALDFDEAELLDLAPDKDCEELFLVTETGKIVYASEVLAENLGYKMQDLLRLPLARLDINTPRGKWLSYVTQMKTKGKPVKFEALHLGRDGSEWRKQVIAKHILYKGKRYVLCVSKQLSLKPTETFAVGPVPDRMTTIMNLVDDGIMIVDTRGIIENANKAMEGLFDIPKSDLVGRSCVDTKWKLVDMRGNPVRLSDHPLTVSLIEEAIMEDIRMAITLPGGSQRVLLFTTAPVYDADQKLSGALAIVRPPNGTSATASASPPGMLLNLHRDLTRTIIDADSVNELERKVCEELAASGAYPLVWIGRVVKGDYRVHPSTWVGEKAEYLLKIKIRYDDSDFSQGPTGRSIKMRELQICTDTQADPTFTPWKKQSARLGLRSFISLPLFADQDVYGVLVVYSSQPNYFMEGEINLLYEISQVLSFGISHIINRDEKREAVSGAVQRIELIEAFKDSYPNAFCLFDANAPFQVLMYNEKYLEMLDQPYAKTGVEGLFLTDFIHSHLHKDLYESLEEVAASKAKIETADAAFATWEDGESHWSWKITPLIERDEVIQLFYTASRKVEAEGKPRSRSRKKSD